MTDNTWNRHSVTEECRLIIIYHNTTTLQHPIEAIKLKIYQVSPLDSKLYTYHDQKRTCDTMTPKLTPSHDRPQKRTQ